MGVFWFVCGEGPGKLGTRWTAVMDCGAAVEGGDPILPVRVDKQEGIVCTGRGQLVTSMEGERRGYEVQLAAVMVCVCFPQNRVAASCVPRTGWGLWQLLSSRPPQAVWPLGAAELLCCAPQLQLHASSQSLVVHPHRSCTGMV